ncbi:MULTISPECIES: hypothetical protein [Methanobacterium]|uniref:Uncharacterized protein n=1 Tax=Methanobacterium bryantii TaxID=2161 RepID=A0A2A2H9J3_METBR|nr:MULTISPECIES: hypothetical protein [Methanobacterium]OEC86852.1 hypothetical protein A9507_07985 [Methanobacterium sp. A39]PAV05913.1 hypothetical protein ASJ80_13725 [Methanobacterium bryantii]
MSTAEITGNIHPKRKIIMGLYWINKKAASTEGCEPFLIEKIITGTNTHVSGENKFLKLSDNILNDILYNMEHQREVKFEIKFGKENIGLSICKNAFSISAAKKELEVEIAEKLESEGKKMYPGICSKFPQRVGIKDYP